MSRFEAKKWLMSIKQQSLVTDVTFLTTNFHEIDLIALNCHVLISSDVGAAAKEPMELFIKNTGLC